MEVKNLSIIFHGPRVTESYKIRNFVSVKRLGTYINMYVQYRALRAQDFLERRESLGLMLTVSTENFRF
jgi:hypothetical protein